MVKDSKDAQIFIEQKEKMQQTAEQKRKEQACSIDRKPNDVHGFVIQCCKGDQHRQGGDRQDRTDEMADRIKIFVAVRRGN